MKQEQDAIFLNQESMEKKKPEQTDKPAENKPSNEASAEALKTDEKVKRNCSPRLMAVKLPAPLGPKLFILGEPVLHRYYSVYDWHNLRVGFALANSKVNTEESSSGDIGVLPADMERLLMQQRMAVQQRKQVQVVQEDEHDRLELLQVNVVVTLRVSA